MRKALYLLIPAVVLFLAPAGAFAVDSWSYFTVLAHATGIPAHIICFVLVGIFLVISGLVIGSRYRAQLAAYETWKTQPIETRGPSPIDPDPNFSLANFFESIIQMVLGLMKDIIGHNYRRFFPIIGSLAFVILFNNIIVLIPGSMNATANVSTNLAMALTVFLLYHFYGIREHGVGKYLAHFMGPLEGPIKYILAPLMVPIELVSHFARPASLTIRLFGNMFGDHTVFVVFLGFMFTLPFLFLGMLVCVVQTLVFTLLSIVYISLAVAHDH